MEYKSYTSLLFLLYVLNVKLDFEKGHNTTAGILASVLIRFLPILCASTPMSPKQFLRILPYVFHYIRAQFPTLEEQAHGRVQMKALLYMVICAPNFWMSLFKLIQKAVKLIMQFDNTGD